MVCFISRVDKEGRQITLPTLLIKPSIRKQTSKQSKVGHFLGRLVQATVRGALKKIS